MGEIINFPQTDNENEHYDNNNTKVLLDNDLFDRRDEGIVTVRHLIEMLQKAPLDYEVKIETIGDYGDWLDISKIQICKGFEEGEGYFTIRPPRKHDAMTVEEIAEKSADVFMTLIKVEGIEFKAEAIEMLELVKAGRINYEELFDILQLKNKAFEQGIIITYHEAFATIIEITRCLGVKTSFSACIGTGCPKYKDCRRFLLSLYCKIIKVPGQNYIKIPLNPANCGMFKDRNEDLNIDHLIITDGEKIDKYFASFWEDE